VALESVAAGAALEGRRRWTSRAATVGDLEEQERRLDLTIRDFFPTNP
jgi:hypothetical protein